LRDPLLRLAAHYLLNARRDGKPVDPWPAFIWAMAPGGEAELAGRHLAKGFDQSLGIMVNYLYDPERIENNVEAFSSDGEVDAAAAVRRMARP
jgi:malonyl-CoA decarboxylase